MFEKKVRALLENSLEERQGLFLIDFKISEGNNIKIIVDGDQGVNVDDCVFISRAIEHHIDRDKYDFSLEVASAGATEPLTHKRQYGKNVGRTLQVKTTDGQSYEATLKAADEDEIHLVWKQREPKPVGKGKVTVQKEVKITYENIEQASVKLKF